ncbi:MAG: TfoX/Sxy family protein [Pseudonocardiaceae bacterium]|nr:TfoX/Sxy family protein [Pseudonocardiaceae bacterium]
MSPDDLLEDIAAETGATAGVMFGKRALKANGKAFACLKGDDLAFRLGDGTPDHGDALDLPGARLFDPSGKGRPFKDWVAVPVACADDWSRLARAALLALDRVQG